MPLRGNLKKLRHSLQNAEQRSLPQRHPHAPAGRGNRPGRRVDQSNSAQEHILLEWYHFQANDCQTPTYGDFSKTFARLTQPARVMVPGRLEGSRPAASICSASSLGEKALVNILRARVSPRDASARA